MLTVREAMKTGGLSKCRLLAGEAGLDNAITCVDCMEVPNIEPWLRSGELLITTGYALRDDENAIPLPAGGPDQGQGRRLGYQDPVFG